MGGSRNVTVRNLGCRSVISNLKKNRSSRLIEVSPRGSNETTVQKETAGMNGFSHQGNDDFAG